MRPFVTILSFLALLLCSGVAIRAQIHLSAHLSAAQEVPATNSQGAGTISLTISEDLREVRYSITVDGLSGPVSAAHFHNAAAGSAGPVVVPLAFSGGTASGAWKETDAKPFTKAMLVELLLGNLYVNVHSAKHPGGEIRAQLPYKAMKVAY